MSSLQIQSSGIIKGGTLNCEVVGNQLNWNLKLLLRGLASFLNELSLGGAIVADSADSLLSKSYQEGAVLNVGFLTVSVLKRDQNLCLCSAKNVDLGTIIENLQFDCSKETVELISADCLINQSGLSILLKVSQ